MFLLKLKNSLLVVKDIEKVIEFYKKILRPHIIMDFGGNNFEIYFEEDDFHKFAEKLKTFDIELFIQLRSIHGDRKFFDFMICINILLKLVKVWKLFVNIFKHRYDIKTGF